MVRKSIEDHFELDTRQYRFYRFGSQEPKSNQRRSRHAEEDIYKMRRFEKDEETTKYRILENDPDAFPFFIDESHSLFDKYGFEELVLVNLKLTHYEKCQHLVKPVLIPKKVTGAQLYEMFDAISRNCSKNYDSESFEYYFGKEGTPEKLEAFPFIFVKNSEDDKQDYIRDAFSKEEFEFEEYEEIPIMVRDNYLKRNKNFGRELSINTTNIQVTQAKITLDSCLRGFTKEEVLDEDNEWYCSKCKEHKQAKKKMSISYLPKILIIHLKRFSKGRYSWSKNTQYVDFPTKNLDLSEFMMQGCESGKYNLYGVINHMGGMGGGHYTAYCKNPAYNDFWIEFDDSHVNKVDRDDVVSKASYVLFYRRNDN